jgi:ubiquitin carboxyl-terminal hydrolase MINDY-3/4
VSLTEHEDDVEDTVLCLIREFLARKGFERTLEMLRGEMKTAPKLTNRATVAKELGLSKLVKKAKRSGRSKLTLLEMVAMQLRSKATKKGIMPSSDHKLSNIASRNKVQTHGLGHHAPVKKDSVMASVYGSIDDVRAQSSPRVSSPSGHAQPYLPTNRARSSRKTYTSTSIHDAADSQSHQHSQQHESNDPTADLIIEDVDDLDIDYDDDDFGVDLGPAHSHSPSMATTGHMFGQPSHHTTPQRVISSLGGKPISTAEMKALNTVVFGADRPGKFPPSWRQQGFEFEEDPVLSYGFRQHEGGSCGVLAVVQAQVAQYWIVEKHIPLDTKFEEHDQNEATAYALSQILWRCGQEQSAQLVLPSGSSYQSILFRNKDQLHSTIQQNIRAFTSPKSQGVILATYSMVLSRGCDNVISDMDSSEGTMIGAHGYCTQELVNLGLAGRAVSNVFDGERNLDDVTKMKGIDEQCDIGFLTLFEHYGYVQVGKNYKFPKYPVWVVCSESHYTVLMGDEAAKDGTTFDLMYHDQLVGMQEPIWLTVSMDPSAHEALDPDTDELVPPINHCIRTKWTGARVDWNGTEPFL